MNRIYVYPWDQLSKSAGAIAKGLDTQKLLRKGSRYNSQDGDVIVNWGASDIDKFINARIDARRDVIVLNQDVTGALDKVAFFERLNGQHLTPAFETDRASAEDLLRFPVLCRTKTKGCDGAGIVIAETKIDLVPAKLYVELEPKTAEYRVHIGRNRDGSTSIIGVQQKFLPKGQAKDMRLRTTANGCYFVWTVNGEQVENLCPPTVIAVTSAAFKLFPELDFVGADVIWNEATGKATVIEFNSAPEMTPQSVARYAGFFQQFRQAPKAVEVAEERMVAIVEQPARKPWEIAYDEWVPAIDKDDLKSAFHAGWDARKALDFKQAYAGPPIHMYGIRGDEGERIDVV